MAALDVALIQVNLSLAILIGFAAKRFGLISNSLEQELARLILRLSLPCLILSSIEGVSLNMQLLLLILIGSSLSYLVLITLAYLLARLFAPNRLRKLFIYIVSFGNVGFIGYGVLSAIWGPEAIIYAALANIPFNLLMYSLGYLLCISDESSAQSLKQSLLASLKSPVSLASFILLGLALFHITSLGAATPVLSLIGSITTPAALLLLGASLAKIRARHLKSSPSLYLAALLRLTLPALVATICLRALGLSALHSAMLALGQCMPTATNGILFRLEKNMSTSELSLASALSIAASLVTIPLIYSLLS